MGELSTNRNSAKYYRGETYHAFSSHEGCFDFFCLMKEIKLLIKIQYDTPKVLCSLFKKLVTVHKEDQGGIALAVAPKMRPCTKHITIKYHYYQIFL